MPNSCPSFHYTNISPLKLLNEFGLNTQSWGCRSSGIWQCDRAWWLQRSTMFLFRKKST